MITAAMLRLSDLPPPPPGRTGWPWTGTGTPLPGQRPDGGAWPVISVVTPSFNQAEYLEETIRSVLLQGYPALEYIIIDGGSTDDSAAIIRRYARWLTYWQSAPDGGQADAVNIGLGHCTGELFNFINSDDILLPGALAQVGALDAACFGLAGSVINSGPEGDELFVHGPVTLAEMLRRDHFHQPGIWLRRAAVAEAGGFDTSYDYCFDKKFYLRFITRHDGTIATTPIPLARFRIHDKSKTSTSHASFRRETLRALHEVLPGISGPAERALAHRRIGKITHEMARDALLAWAAETLEAPGAGLAARLQVAKKLWSPEASGARPRLIEILVFGPAGARMRSIARKSRRAMRSKG